MISNKWLQLTIMMNLTPMNTNKRISSFNANTQSALRLKTMQMKLNELAILVTLVSISLVGLMARAQCPRDAMTTFERVGGVTLKNTPMSLLYSVNNSSVSSMMAFSDSQEPSLPGIPITAECNNRCRKSYQCRAFLVDYARQLCYSIEQLPQSNSNSNPHQHQSLQSSSSSSSSQSVGGQNHIMLIGTHERSAYFEKHCFKVATLDCERAWIFERVLGHQLLGHDDRIIENVMSRIRCQEYCLAERQFKCRSGEYDYEARQCRLSSIDRHVQPRLFRQATGLNLDYFENQCVNLGTQCDPFDKFDNMDLGRAEILRSANSSEQCQHLCTNVIKAFNCRSFTWNPATGKCYLNSANTFTVGGLERLLPAPGLTYYQRTDCFDLQLDCDHTAMTVNLRTNEPFRGRMYVRDEPLACETQGRSTLSSQLHIPFQSQARCAQRELVNRFSSVVVVQHHPLIQRRSDRYIKLVCDFQTSNKTVTSNYNVVANPWTSTALINATSLAPKIRLRITDRFSNDVAGAKLGDELFLNIEAETDSAYDMVARSVMAKSGGTESESIMLIDKDGCPTDPRIFPALKKLNRRMIRGKFDAFKFSTDVVVRFQVDVQFCLNSCPVSVCDPALAAAAAAAALASGLSPPNKADFANGLDTYSADLSPTPTLGQQSAETTNRFNSQASTLSMLPVTQSPLEPFSAISPLNSQANLNGTSRAPLNYPQPAGQQENAFSSNQSPLKEHVPSHKQQQQLPTRQLLQYPANQPANFTSNANPQATNNLNSEAADTQTFEARSPGNNQRDYQSNTIGQAGNRRRRSAEPLPTVPAHVPLQGEIIIRDRDDPKPTAPAQKRSKESSSKRAGRGEQGPILELNQWDQINNKIPMQKQQQTPVNNIGDAQTPTQAAIEAQAANLLCTNRHSLIVSMFAFCAFQFLTLGLCLITWFHKQHNSSKDCRDFKSPHKFWLTSNAFAAPTIQLKTQPTSMLINLTDQNQQQLCPVQTSSKFRHSQQTPSHFSATTAAATPTPSTFHLSGSSQFKGQPFC